MDRNPNGAKPRLVACVANKSYGFTGAPQPTRYVPVVRDADTWNIVAWVPIDKHTPESAITVAMEIIDQKVRRGEAVAA